MKKIVILVLVAILSNGCKKTEESETVIKKEPILTWANPADITFLTPLSETQLNATADVPGTYKYTPASGVILSEGTDQVLNVLFTPTDATNYNPANKTVAIIVGTSICSKVSDYDGNVYNTVVIGTQIWMVENLKVTHYRNGDLIPNVIDIPTWISTTSGAYCWYQNNIANKADYGALYNWYTVADARSIAPDGWHIPTDIEWTELITFIGGRDVAGSKMKEYGDAHWLLHDNLATNETGFTAVPGGSRDNVDGLFRLKGHNNVYWTSTSFNETNALYRYISSDNNYCIDGDYNKRDGFSVRCIKD